MILSMTGFGGGSFESDLYSYTVEVKAVNSRFLDISVKIRRDLASLENEITREVKKFLNRGKVEIFVNVNSLDSRPELPRVNQLAVKHYAEQFDQLQHTLGSTLQSSFGSIQDPSATDLFALPGVLEKNQESDQVDHQEPLMSCLAIALEELVESRKVEGEGLKTDILKHLTNLKSCLGEFQDEQESIDKRIRERAVERITQVFSQIKLSDDSSLDLDKAYAEAAILIDKADISEELSRLEIHLESLDALCSDSQASVGRKLDFLCQEVLREINTIGSKSQFVDGTKRVVDMKHTIEKIKQQVQNVE